jgi:DNA-binding MarR family transcriptional regulator
MLSNLSHSAEVFRRFTREVFASQAVLLRHGDVANEKFGQSSARWRVLARISDGDASVAAIARSTGYSRQAVQRLADALAAEGLVGQERDERDRRRQRLELTGAGAEMFRQMEAHFDGWAERLMAHIPEADLIALSQSLEHIRLIVQADLEYLRRKEA